MTQDVAPPPSVNFDAKPTMKCPIDGAQLLMTERQGVEIDYCPQCRGVWLDRGEIDKIIERTMTQGGAPEGRDAPREYRGGDEHRYGDKYGEKRRKRGFLGELFD